nr:ABC transporter substrate-binding protein [Bacteroidota bacterium]
MIIFLWGCNQNQIDKRGEREVIDMHGRTVMIPAKITKIIAINAGMLRLICWLDATEYICAVEGNEKKRQVPYLYAYPELRNLPIIGTRNSAEAELLVAASPDIILSTYITASEADVLQKKTGVPVLAVKYGNFDDGIDTVFSALHFLGNILNKNERADKLTKYIREIIFDLDSRTSNITQNPPSVYVGGIAYRGSHGITSTEPRYPSFRFLNTPNVAGSLDPVMTSPKDMMLNAFIDKEQLIEWNPDFIFLDAGSLYAMKAQMLQEPWLEILKAFEEQNVYSVLPYNWYTTNYSTILVNSYFIGKILYPEAFSDVNPEDKAHEIYGFILGKSVYDQMQARYKPFVNISINE